MSPAKNKVSDEFQQFKGILGQEIAKLYLERVARYEIVGEELGIVGLQSPKGGRSPAKFDILVRDNKKYRPVEVKFQQAQIKSYGTAFDFILKQLYKM